MENAHDHVISNQPLLKHRLDECWRLLFLLFSTKQGIEAIGRISLKLYLPQQVNSKRLMPYLSDFSRALYTGKTGYCTKFDDIISVPMKDHCKDFLWALRKI